MIRRYDTWRSSNFQKIQINRSVQIDSLQRIHLSKIQNNSKTQQTFV